MPEQRPPPITAAGYLDAIPNPLLSHASRSPTAQRRSFLEKIDSFECTVAECRQAGNLLDPENNCYLDAMVLAIAVVGNLDLTCLTHEERRSIETATQAARKWSRTKLSLPAGNSYTPVYEAILNLASR